MDDVDHASEIETQHREAAIAAARRFIPAVGDGAPNLERDCRTCGEPIPRERLEAVPHAEDCVFCQSEREGR